MALSKHSSRDMRSQPTHSGILFLLPLLITSVVQAGVIPLFDPLKPVLTTSTNIHIQRLTANDAVPLRDFFNDWDGKFDPKENDNIFIHMSRMDIGTLLLDRYYIGYFYQKDIFAKSNRGFVDAYHAIKNHREFDTTQAYDLTVDINGIEKHGILLSDQHTLFTTNQHSIKVGYSAYISYDTDLQQGNFTGEGSIMQDDTYSISGLVDYYFMDNLLYDGWDTDSAYGIGYGFHFGLLYENSRYNMALECVANDILAKSYWKHIPYSLVHLETDNQAIGDDGYVQYDPTISGKEIYENITQKIPLKTHIAIKKYLDDGLEFQAGLDSVKYTTIPYISMTKSFGEKKITLLYEHRFKSIGIGYQDKNFSLSIQANGLKNTSVLGFAGEYSYQF